MTQIVKQGKFMHSVFWLPQKQVTLCSLGQCLCNGSDSNKIWNWYCWRIRVIAVHAGVRSFERFPNLIKNYLVLVSPSHVIRSRAEGCQHLKRIGSDRFDG